MAFTPDVNVTFWTPETVTPLRDVGFHAEPAAVAASLMFKLLVVPVPPVMESPLVNVAVPALAVPVMLLVAVADPMTVSIPVDNETETGAAGIKAAAATVISGLTAPAY